jgi:hypothetical protein
LAAAVHDFEHKGVNNDFLVKTYDERATRYNDQHVNEQHHAAAALALLRRPEFNFFAEVSDDIYRYVRRLVISLVLNTDLASHADFVKSLKELPLPESDEFTAREMDQVLQATMKCADLGHLALDWEKHLEWAHLLQDEFFLQGDREKSLGLSVSPFMDRDKPGPMHSQLGFIDFVALPLFEGLVRACPTASPALDAVRRIHKRWVDIDIARAQTDGAEMAIEH